MAEESRGQGLSKVGGPLIIENDSSFQRYLPISQLI